MTMPGRPRPSRWRWLALIPIAAGLIAAIVSFTTSSGSAPAGDRDGADQVCREQVLGKLRAPATARFTEGTVSFLPGQTAEFYTARGMVDAQNGYGAMLRLRYQCDITRERDGWRVTSTVVG